MEDAWEKYLNDVRTWLSQVEAYAVEGSELQQETKSFRKEISYRTEDDAERIQNWVEQLHRKVHEEEMSTCQQFGVAVGGKAEVKQGVCSVELHRHFKTKIDDKTSTSAVPVGLTFESLDEKGMALNLAEIAVVQGEVGPFLRALARQGLTVSALHNHWINMDPLIMYVHVQEVGQPVEFANKMTEAFKALTKPPTG